MKHTTFSRCISMLLKGFCYNTHCDSVGEVIGKYGTSVSPHFHEQVFFCFVLYYSLRNKLHSLCFAVRSGREGMLQWRYHDEFLT